MTDNDLKQGGYPQGRSAMVAVDEVDDPDPLPGALDDDLLPNWHVLDGVACSWRMVAIFDTDATGLMLMCETWHAPVRGAPPRWCSVPERAMGLRSEQTVKLIELLGKPPQVTTLALCESTRLGLHPDQLHRFVVMPGCERCAELARIGNP